MRERGVCNRVGLNAEPEPRIWRIRLESFNMIPFTFNSGSFNSENGEHLEDFMLTD